MEVRRKSMLDNTRNNNFLRRSFGTSHQPSVLTREDYLHVLRREHQKWKSLYKDKKRSIMRKQPDVIIRREDVFTSFIALDQVFRSDRPNYLEISQRAKHYIQIVQFHTKQALAYKERYETLAEDIAEEIDNIVDTLLLAENAICSVCNNGYCTKELHPLLGRENNFSSIISDMVDLQLTDY